MVSVTLFSLTSLYTEVAIKKPAFAGSFAVAAIVANAWSSVNCFKFSQPL